MCTLIYKVFEPKMYWKGTKKFWKIMERKQTHQQLLICPCAAKGNKHITGNKDQSQVTQPRKGKLFYKMQVL